MIRVVGCPRSGLGYTAKVLRHLGYRVGHERMGEDGIADWHQMPADVGPGDMVIHVVRDPRPVTASLRTMLNASLRDIRKATGMQLDREPNTGESLRRRLKYWQLWNTMWWSFGYGQKLSPEGDFSNPYVSIRVERLISGLVGFFLHHTGVYQDNDRLAAATGVPTNYHSRSDRPIYQLPDEEEFAAAMEGVCGHDYQGPGLTEQLCCSSPKV